MKNPIKQGAMDRSFLLDTVRHISRNFEIDKKDGAVMTPPYIA
jgi:hypothetical protein